MLIFGDFDVETMGCFTSVCMFFGDVGLQIVNSLTTFGCGLKRFRLRPQLNHTKEQFLSK